MHDRLLHLSHFVKVAVPRTKHTKLPRTSKCLLVVIRGMPPRWRLSGYYTWGATLYACKIPFVDFEKGQVHRIRYKRLYCSSLPKYHTFIVVVKSRCHGYPIPSHFLIGFFLHIVVLVLKHVWNICYQQPTNTSIYYTNTSRYDVHFLKCLIPCFKKSPLFKKKSVILKN